MSFFWLPFAVDAEGPLAPDKAVASFKTHPGLEIELVAAEPLVMDPVAFDWDAQGRLWVVEMRDYPNGLTWKKPDDPHDEPGGRVKILTDTDEDGRYDTATLFLDGLNYPTGIKVWKDGVLISAAPEIFFARDTDGDGEADERETWYAGFAESNQQHRVNGFAWGLDNWLHVSNGDGGGVIETKGGDVNRDAVDIRGHDFRINPFTREIRLLSGRTQCGRFRDDWGNWFGCNNSNPLWHFPLNYDHISRNPLVAAPSAAVDIQPEKGASPVSPISKTETRFNQPDRANRFTSVCGPTIYRGGLIQNNLPGQFALVCEPVHNLVAKFDFSLNRDTATFTTSRMVPADDDGGFEFASSRDNWHRPVSVRTGPDGALWIADMYRAVIEHPEWIPHDVLTKIDVRAGHDKGRIYRVKPKGKTFAAADLKIGDPLVELHSINGTRRDLAHQMLLWQGQNADVKQLRDITKKAETPQTRMHALSVLSGLGKLDEATLRHGLSDTPEVARHAIRHLNGKVSPLEASKSRRELPDFLVMEMAGAIDESEPHAATLITLGFSTEDDHVIATALSSVTRQNITAVVRDLGKVSRDYQPKIYQALAKMAAVWDVEPAVAELQKKLASSDEEMLTARQLAILIGFSTAKKLHSHIEKFAPQIRDIAPDNPAVTRLLAITESTPDAIVALLTPTTTPPIRDAVFDALARQAHPKTAGQLLGKWSTFTPADREKCQTLMLSRGEWVEHLLASLEAKEISANQIGAAARNRLLKSSTEKFRNRATKIFASATNAGRAEILAAHADVLKMKGEAIAGKTVFATACIACHVAEGQGNSIGPDLAAVTDRSAKAMLTAILDPNRAVEDKFMAYQISTTSDQDYVGMIASENANHLSLQLADGTDRQIPRADIKTMKNLGMSLMPDGLEATLTKQQLADVIAYISGLGSEKPKPAAVLSARIRPDAKGVVELRASKCRLTGGRIEYMADFDAIGWWTGLDDRAEWTIVLDRPGKFTVEWEWSVDDKSAGNGWQMLANGKKILSGKINKSGGWEEFKTETLGQIHLPAADTKLVIKPDGSELNNALMDLRWVRFTPISE